MGTWLPWTFSVSFGRFRSSGLAGRTWQDGTATHVHSRGTAPHPAPASSLFLPVLGFLLCEQAANSTGLLRVWEGRRDPVSCAAVWK